MADWKKLLDEAVDQVGEGIKVAGEGIKSVADDARKVAGIGIGTIEIQLTNGHYSLGDTVTGVVKMELPEPIEAKRLVVALVATRSGMTLRRGSDGRTSPVSRTETLHNFECEVSGQDTYTSGEHHFAVHIPDELDPKFEGDGLLGEAVRAAQTLKSMTESTIRWKLHAFLDIPWKRNLSNERDLSVG